MVLWLPLIIFFLDKLVLFSSFLNFWCDGQSNLLIKIVPRNDDCGHSLIKKGPNTKTKKFSYSFSYESKY